MKVLLPSHGILGQRAVELRMPTFKVLYELQSYNTDELLRKFKFVELISDADFNHITAMDLDYLYNIGAFSLSLNTIKYNIKCVHGCDIKLEKIINIADLDIVEVKITNKDLPFIKRIRGVKFKYNILSAKQVLDAYEWAQFEEDSEQAFQDAQVAAIMGREVSDREYVQALPISVYAGAFLFQRMNYHGLNTESSVKCSKCGKITKFNFRVGTSLLQYDIDKIMSRYVAVSDTVSLEDFMTMSIVDYNSLVTALNNQLK